MADERDQGRYTREEVEEILRRAAQRTHESGEDLRHDELVAAAREAGIDVGAVESAAGELAAQREDRVAIEAWRAARRRSFASHALTWLVVNAGLFLIDLLSGGGWWFFWPLLGWGIAVALHALRAFRAPTERQVERITRKDRRRREAERRREARRLEREARRDRDRDQRHRRKRIEREFERAVENGVAALLEVASRRLGAVTRRDEAPLPDTEFNRYVARKKGGPGPVDAPPAEARGPRVRVDAPDDREPDDDAHETRSSRRARRR